MPQFRFRSTRLALVVLMLCTAAAITTEILPVGLLPSMSRGLHVTEQAAGLLVSVYAVLVAVLAIPLAAVIVRLPRKAVLLGTIAAYALSNILVAVGPDFAAVAAGRAVGGVAHAVFFPVSVAFATSLVRPERYGRTIAFISSGASVGYIAGVPLATSLGAVLGWRASFAIIAGFEVVLIAIAALLLPVSHRVPAAAQGSGRGSLRPLLVVGVANAIGFMAHYGLYTYIAPLFLMAGIPEAAIGGVLFVLAIAGLIGLAVAGLVIDSRPRAAFLAALSLAVLGVALTGVIRGTPGGAIVGTAVWLLAFGAIPTFFSSASNRASPASAEFGSSVNNAASNVGIALGAVVGGAVFVSGGLSELILVSAGLFAATAVIIAVGRTAFPSGPIRLDLT